VNPRTQNPGVPDAATRIPSADDTTISPVLITVIVAAVVVVVCVGVCVAISARGSGATSTHFMPPTTAGAGAQICTDHGCSRNIQHGEGCYVDVSDALPLYMGPTRGYHEWGHFSDDHTRAQNPVLAAWRHYDGYHEAAQDVFENGWL